MYMLYHPARCILIIYRPSPRARAVYNQYTPSSQGGIINLLPKRSHTSNLYEHMAYNYCAKDYILSQVVYAIYTITFFFEVWLL